MKRFLQGLGIVMILLTMAGCDAFNTLGKKKAAQGRPYELIVVCPQMEWNGELGDSLRTILTAPVPYLNQDEPLFDVLRVTERGFKDMIADHRNILKIVVDLAPGGFGRRGVRCHVGAPDRHHAPGSR